MCICVYFSPKSSPTKGHSRKQFFFNCLGNSLKNTKKREDNPMGVNIVVNTVVNTLWHKNGVSSKERPEKPAAAEIKNSISKSNNKPGEKKDKTKKTTKEDDVKVKIPRKSKVPQERNLRKRNHAESTAEEPDEACSKFQKFQNHQETQVTPSMIDNDEELSTINSQHSNDKASDAILKNKTYYVSIPTNPICKRNTLLPTNHFMS